MKRRLSITGIRRYWGCPERYRIADVERVRPVQRDRKLRLGSLVHQGRDQIWQGQHPEIEHDDPFLLEAARAILDCYLARWGFPSGQVRTEVSFAVPLRSPLTGAASPYWEFVGTIDDLFTGDIGSIVPGFTGHGVSVGEFKTTTDDIGPGSPYIERLRLDSQVSAYWAGARSLGFEPGWCIYDIVRKPQLQPLKKTENIRMTKERRNKAGVVTHPSRPCANQRLVDETPIEFGDRIRATIAKNPDKYLRRVVVVRLERDHEAAAWDLWNTAAQIRISRRTGRWHRNTVNCKQWGRMCEYFPVCTGAADLNSTMYRRLETQ